MNMEIKKIKHKAFLILAGATFFLLLSITLTHAQESTLEKDVREVLDQYGSAVGSKSFSKMADC